MDLKHCLHVLSSRIAAEPSTVTCAIDQVVRTESNDSHRLETSILQIPRMWWQADVLPCVLTFFQQRGWYLSHFLESYAAIIFGKLRSKWLLLWREAMRILWQKRRCGSSLALLMFRSIAGLCRLVVPMATSINIHIQPVAPQLSDTLKHKDPPPPCAPFPKTFITDLQRASKPCKIFNLRWKAQTLSEISTWIWLLKFRIRNISTPLLLNRASINRQFTTCGWGWPF